MRTLLATTPAEICERDYSKRSPEEKLTLMQYLSELEFFSNLPNPVLSDVADKMRTFPYEKGSFLTKQGEKGDCMFVLAAGSVEILIDNRRVAEFSACHVIGEAALQLDVPRTASVAATSSVLALRLSRLDFESTLSVFKKKERRSAVDFLSSSSVLSTLGLPKLQRLSTILISTAFTPGQVIFDVGAISQSFYILREGQVTIEAYATVEDSLRTPVNKHAWRLKQVSRKIRVLIRESSPGDVFGLADLPSRKGRKTRATAKSPCFCYIINLHQFLELFTERDLDELLICEDMRLPKMQELVAKAHEDLTVMKEKRKSLLRAYNIADEKFAGRDWAMDQKTKRMKGWMNFMRKCMATEVANMQRKVVSTHKSMRLVSSLSELQALTEVKPKS
jgi:CRP-like cAMP-binding protein